jgi:hypothetical protein
MNAPTLKQVVEEMVIGPVYSGLLSVGVDPSVV